MRISDWSSDVCSSDLIVRQQDRAEPAILLLAFGAVRPVEIDPGLQCLLHRPDRFGSSDQHRFGLARMDRLRGFIDQGLRLVAADDRIHAARRAHVERSEEHTSELQSLMRNSYAVFCLKK